LNFQSGITKISPKRHTNLKMTLTKVTNRPVLKATIPPFVLLQQLQQSSPQKAEPQKGIPNLDLCLQCHILGLRCSLTSEKPVEAPVNPQIPQKEKQCTRCVRNSQDFCIVQKITKTEAGIKECEYSSHGVPKEVVWARVSEIIEHVQRRNRWALPLPVPKMEVEVKEGQNLKPSDCVRSI
jgi:hypothetical protein